VFLPEASRLVATPGAAVDGPVESQASAGESTLERVYNWKGLIPQSIKFPAKMTLGRALAWAIERRNRRHHGEALEALERADREALDFFRGGGNLHDWEARGRRFAGPGSGPESGA
jgi:hypothetical protein